LGALERRKVKPLGATASRAIDVRVIAATNRNLGREMNQGRFRPDLYYRLAVVRVSVPPLRERLDDLPLLVTTFLEQLRARYGERVPRELSSLVLNRMAAHSWPGNVRELRNSVERAVLQSGEPLPAPLAESAPYQAARDHFIAGFERDFLLQLLEQCEFNVTSAAQRTGVELRYFRRLLQRYGLSARSRR
jgi:DNA-binding NtrC family response regulator